MRFRSLQYLILIDQDLWICCWLSDEQGIVWYIVRFTRAQVEQLDKIKQWSRALDGSDYLPGMVSGPFQLKVYFSAFQW